MIPQNQLHEGYKKGKELIIRLFGENEFFYKQKQYSTSISISILIKEEVTKLNLIRNHIINKSKISEEDWRLVSSAGSHGFKLKKPYTDALKEVKALGEERYNKIVKMEETYGTNQEFKSFFEVSNENKLVSIRLEALNKIKQACWYLDWQNSQWITLSSIYSEKELELFANYLLQITGYEIANEILNYKYPLAFYHEIPPQASLMRKDPLWKKREEFYELLKNENFEKIINVVANIIDNFPTKITDTNINSQTKETWPIPKNHLLNGAILALKNAKKLLKDSQYAFSNKRYSIALTLAVLSFEEFGKHFMIRKFIDSNKIITPKIWFSEFTRHEIKLNAMLNYLNVYVSTHEKREFDQDANELMILIKNWRHNKLNAIYLNWSKTNHKWYTFDDLDLEARKKEAELAISIIERFFTIYVEETRNPNFLTIEELIDLVKNSKLYFECVDCHKMLNINNEIIVHEKSNPNHRIAFHFSK